MDIRDLLVAAINDKKVVAFTYEGTRREAEPHRVWRDEQGDLKLLCWQIEGTFLAGKAVGWREMFITKISFATNTGRGFSCPRPRYQRVSTTTGHIYAQL